MVEYNFNIQELENNTTADKETAAWSESKSFKEPGEYVVTIVDVQLNQKSSPNSHWATFMLTLKSEEGKEIKHFIDVPLSSNLTFMTSKGKESYAVYGAFKRACCSVGLAETVNDIQAKDVATFAPIFLKDGGKSVFEGKDAKITLAWRYKTVHTELVEGFFILKDHEGKVVIGSPKFEARKEDSPEDADVYSWKDASEEMKIYAQEKDLKYEGFLKVEGFALLNKIAAKKETKSLF